MAYTLSELSEFRSCRHCQERWPVDLEIGTRRRNCFRYSHCVALSHPLKWHMRVVRGLAGKLDLKVGINRWGRGRRLGKPGEYDDHGKLPTACHLQHAKIAVAVPGIE